MGGAVSSPCCLFGLRRPITGAYRLLGRARPWSENGSLQEGSRQWVLPRTITTSVLVPPVSHSVSPPLQETLQYQQVGLAQALMRSLLFSLGPGAHETLCEPSKSGISVSPNPVESLLSNPAGLQSWFLWGLLLLLRDPQAGKPDVGLRIFTPVRELLWYNYFPVCGLPTRHVWDLILSCFRPFYCLSVASLSLDVGYLFW